MNTATVSGSTFEKHVLSAKVLDARQMASIHTAQNVLRGAGVEKSEEEVALLLKLIDPYRLAQITADVKAKYNISLQKPSDFTLSPEKDQEFIEQVAMESDELAQRVEECGRIQADLKKLGIHLSVSEILIAKKYVTPPEGKGMTAEVVITEITKKLKAIKRDRVTNRRDNSNTKKKDKESERYAAPSAVAEKKKQMTLLASIGGIVAAVVVIALVVAMNGGDKKTRHDQDTASKDNGTAKQPEQPEQPKPIVAPLPPPPKTVAQPEPPKPATTAAIAPPSTTASAVQPPPPDTGTGIAPAAETVKDKVPSPPPPTPASTQDPAPSDPTPSDPSSGDPAPATPDKPTPLGDKVKLAAERDSRANKLWNDAQKLINDKNWSSALETLRHLRQKYMDTRTFFDHRKEVIDQILDCGYKVAAAGLTKQTVGKKPHIDTILGFRVQPPADWRGIPNWQDFFGFRDTSEVEYRGQSYRCARYTSRWLEQIYMDFYKTYAPEGVDGIAEGALSIYTRQYKGLKEISSSTFKHPRGYISKRVIHQDEDGNRLAVYAFFEPQGKKGFGIVGYWMTENDAIAWFKDSKSRAADEAEWTSALKVYDETAKTFEIMDQSTLAAMRVSAKSWGIANDGWCVKCADMEVLNTENYVIEYSCRKDFAVRLGKEMENILRLYRILMPITVNIKRGRVKLFDCEEDFLYYGQAYGAAAYWSPGQREIVAYRFEGREVKVGEAKEGMTVAEEKNPEEVTFNIVYHEAFHQYMENMMGMSRDVYVPSWLNEGMGDYFFGGRWLKNGKFEIGLNDWRLETIVEAVKKKKHVPLKKIFYFTQAQYYSDAGLCYAEGWAICYFFMSDEGRKKGYANLLSAMFHALKTSGDSKKATDKVFASTDIDRMEAEWVNFVLGLEKFLPKKDGEKKDEPAPPQKQR